MRILAKESAKARARQLHPEIAAKNHQQMAAYRDMADEELFDVQWVRVQLAPEDMPGYKADRPVCAQCGEPISFRREVVRDGLTVCRSCAGERYYTPL